MIRFKVVRWRNFLSTGNQFTEIQLDRSLSTLIIGVNGGGKSTLIDCIVFALYGKPFRDINKGQLVNSINRKELEVELEFSAGTKQYKIVRGMKPNKFEIYFNDELINQDAATKDYQAYLEENILKLNYKSFTQNSILASAKYVPFMQLPAATRREVIEDLLDIAVFSKMNDVLKEKASGCKSDIVNLERDLDVARMKLDTQVKYIEKVENDNLKAIQDLTEGITKAQEELEHKKERLEQNKVLRDNLSEPNIPIIEEKLEKLQKKKDKLSMVVDELSDKKDEYSKELLKPVVSEELDQKVKQVEGVEKEISETRALLTELNSKNAKFSKELSSPIESDELTSLQDGILKNEEQIKFTEKEINELKFEKTSITKEAKFFVENEVCPTCTQSISDEFKKTTLEGHRLKIEELDKMIESRSDYIATLTRTNENLREHRDSIKENFLQKRKDVLAEIAELIDEHEASLRELTNSVIDLNKEVVDIKAKHNESKIAELNELSEGLEKAKFMLKECTNEIVELIVEHTSLVNSLENQKNKCQSAIDSFSASIQSEQQIINKMELEIADKKKSNSYLDEENEKKKEFEESIVSLETQYNEKHIDKKYIDVALSIMKDNGIKTSIIKQYIPVINKLINSYLQIMDLFVEYELDETFNEKIKARYRDEFSYASFSEGEKARIDLAILFTFRAIAKMKSTSSTSLLLLDETFDGSIDADGSDAIAAILRTLEDTNVFCISHNEKMFDKFRSMIKFGKVNNYSVIL